MKKILLVILSAIGCTATFAQGALQSREQAPQALQVKELKLQNGMTVWLNEDHSQPKVYGAVVVKAGAKDCPGTGIAHYFEHIMFKGTDRIGTVDYEAERPWLDSISAQYDLLAQTTDEAQRAAIQKHINQLSLRAADYAIPNEFSRLISRYGGSGLNAATSQDVTYYYNTFLPQYLEQWCWLNSERLLNPVFRLFQGELENVYEEKNRGADGLMGAYDHVMEAVFKQQPYAQSVLGTTESLKNPRLSEMAAFFKKYYVASNMGLLLCGDLDASRLQPLLERTFGRVQTGPVPTRNTSAIEPFKRGESATIKLPIPIIKAEALVYRAPTDFEPDADALDLVNKLLSNGKAGLLDSLTNAHAVTVAGAMRIALNDAGVTALFVVPKIPFGKKQKAVDLCLAQVRRIQQGDFSDARLEELKQETLQEMERSVETISDRADVMLDVFAQGRSWQDHLDRMERVRRLTRSDIVRAAQRYYSEEHLTLVKRFGTDKKETLQQPGYVPVQPKQTGAKSAFAQQLEQMPVNDKAIRLTDFDTDIERLSLSPHVTLYTKQNPVNDLFSFSIRYQDGTLHTPLLGQLSGYLPMLGTDSLTKQQLESAWQQLGVTMETVGGDERFTITISGRDDHLEPALQLLAHFLRSAKGDKEALKEMKQGAKVDHKGFGEQKDDVLMPMISYLRYGQQSEYLRQPSLKEVKALTDDRLLALFRELQTYDCELFYCGRLTPQTVATLSQRHLPLAQCRQPRADTHRVPQTVSQPTVYFYHVPRSRQNYVATYETLAPADNWKERITAQLWARYMGGGMSSVLFQNIREFRSLAYSTQGALAEPNYNRHATDPLAFLTITGTQADKTLQAMQAVDTLMRQMPMKEENLEAARQELLSQVQTNYPDARHIGFYIANQLNDGYTADRYTQRVELLPQLTAADVERYQQQHVASNQRVWIVIGDRKQTDLKALQRYGRVVELKKADIYR